MTSRRAFTKYAAAIAAFGVLPARRVLAHVQDAGVTAHELRTGIWHLNGGGGNTLLLGAPDARILVDTKVVDVAPDLEDALAKLSATPALVINTHHHFDHVGGNFLFRNAEIVAHANLTPRLKDVLTSRVRPGLETLIKDATKAGDTARAERLRAYLRSVDESAFRPDRTIRSESIIRRGEVEMRLMHFGNGHTDNDLVVHFPKLNMVHTGDLCFHRCFTFIDRKAGATTRGWQKSIDRMIALCDDKTVVVPGHGAITDVQGLHEQRRYFDLMRDAVGALRKDGGTVEDAKKLKPDFTKGYELEFIRPLALQAIWEELAEEDA